SAATSVGRSISGPWPTPGRTTSRSVPPWASRRSKTARVWAIIGCEGNTASPGQPGTAPSLPSVPKSNIDASLTTWSASPRIQSNGAGAATVPNALVSHHFGDIALFTPRGAGPTPGQFSLGVEPPG